MFRYVEYVGPWAEFAHGAEALPKVEDQLLDAAGVTTGQEEEVIVAPI